MSTIDSTHRFPSKLNKSRIVGWTVIAIYTLILPDAILVYQKIVSLFGQQVAGKVPLVAAIILGLSYLVLLLIRKRDWKNILFLLPAAWIAFAIFTLEPNPNKHIHIPEYVLMTWLLYWVLSKDIKGREIFLLIFIYAVLLGVTDELEQGIHPARFYGLSDMLVNFSSALIGILTIMGLTEHAKSNWTRINELKKYKWLVWLAVSGLVLVILTCTFLFRVQAENMFWGVYPTWLWIGNILFLIFTLLELFLDLRDYRGKIRNTNMQEARIWINPMLVILFYMQTLVVYIGLSGIGFK